MRCWKTCPQAQMWCKGDGSAFAIERQVRAVRFASGKRNVTADELSPC